MGLRLVPNCLLIISVHMHPNMSERVWPSVAEEVQSGN